ncbi:hypothetical protein, partial [Novosphingobium sp.]|uniref:hypothetical protein n=1 Tax=Novosphingobium sp. TaxID=1874826 RepID=UPI0035AF0DDA
HAKAQSRRRREGVVFAARWRSFLCPVKRIGAMTCLRRQKPPRLAFFSASLRELFFGFDKLSLSGVSGGSVDQTLTLSLSKGGLACANCGQRKRRQCRLFPSILPEANRPGILRPVPDVILILLRRPRRP